MKAAFIRAPFDIAIREIEMPELVHGSALVRVNFVGVCGTDVHLAQEWAADWTRFGHETVGTVVATGPGVSDLTEGDLVAVRATTFCGVCHHCMAGDPRYCLDWRSTRMSVGFAEHIVVPRQSIWPVRDLDPRAASLIEPLAVSLDVVNTADIGIGDNVCIIGPGPIGIMATRLARLRGARRVIVCGTSSDRARLEVCANLGADICVVAEGDELATAVGRATRGVGADRVIVTAPPSAVPQALSIARYGAIISFVGFSSESAKRFVELDLNALHSSKHQLRGSYASPVAPFSVANDLLADDVVPADKIITHELPFEQLSEALRLAQTHDDRTVKATVRVS